MNKEELIEFLESLKQSHHISEDCLYSCPESGECCNDEEKGCNCGASAHNERIDKFIEKL